MKKIKYKCFFFCLTVLPVLVNSQPVLLPRPEKVTYQQGKLLLRNITLYSSPAITKEERFALDELKQIIKESTGTEVVMVASPALSRIRYTVSAKEGVLPQADAITGTSRREEYEIEVTSSRLQINANTTSGLYYAVQTIRQLVEGTGATASLPAVIIKDKPRLAYRGVMMDFAHGGLPAVEEIERQIDFLARWKINQYYFYNEVSIEMPGYPTLNQQAHYTRDQVRGIIEYAKKRHIEVIPFVTFYGHLHELLRNEKYAGLAIGQYGHELDPRKPGVAQLLRDWIGQYTSLFSSPFIHVGFDETWETKRLSADTGRQINAEELFIQQLTFIQKELMQKGKTVLAWTDMTNFFPDIIGRFPKEVVPVIWEYTPDSNRIRHYLNPVLKEKRPFFIQPAVSGWGHVYPSANYTYDNIDLCLQEGMANHTVGFITSVWTDAVEPFIRSSWMFMAYGSIASWQGEVPDKNGFTSSYTNLIYPAIAKEMKQALESIAEASAYLEKCLGKNTEGLPRGTITESWSNPFTPYQLTNTGLHAEDFRASRRLSEEAQALLLTAMQKASQKDRLMLNSLLVSSRLINYTATRFLWARLMTDRWNEAIKPGKSDDYMIYDMTYSCHSLLVDVMDETSELKVAYTQAWNSENKPYRLQTMLGRFDVEYGLWRKLFLKILDYKIQHPDMQGLKSFEETFKPDF